MNEGYTTLFLLGTLMALVALGLPFAFAIGGAAIITSWILWGPNSLAMVPAQTLGTMQNFVLLSVPLFILMASFLEKSGIADALYQFVYVSLGRFHGGLAVGTVIICTLFAAMAGISGAATVSMGLIALPSMLKRGYSKDIALGCISAGGALGILIPPSVSFIIYGVMAGVSVGKLFAGGILPGLLLSGLFITYILIRTRIQPRLGPPIPPDERPSLRGMIVQFKSLVLPMTLIIIVLGSIFSGIATPTEAAAVGSFGAILCTAINRRFTWKLAAKCGEETLKLTAMIMWIVIAASWLSSVYSVAGGSNLINGIISQSGVNRWVVIIAIQITLLVLGMIMDPTGIIMITVPIFAPIIIAFNFDPVWFGVLFVINMEMAFITPPFGYNLFYMKAIAPEDVSMGDIYRSIAPFVFLQLIGLIIVMIFPQIATFVPNLLFN